TSTESAPEIIEKIVEKSLENTPTTPDQSPVHPETLTEPLGANDTAPEEPTVSEPEHEEITPKIEDHSGQPDIIRSEEPTPVKVGSAETVRAPEEVKDERGTADRGRTIGNPEKKSDS